MSKTNKIAYIASMYELKRQWMSVAIQLYWNDRNRQAVVIKVGYNSSIIYQNDYVYGQVNKRIGRMPWQLEAMKDVRACDKLWGGGN